MAEVYEDPSPGQQRGGAEWSLREAIAKGIAGTIGILAALVIDYIQKGNDSALLFATKLINNAALTRFHIEAVPPYIYLAVLLIAGFAMVYIFEPTNKRNAFYAGAGVLGFLATFSPIAQQTLQIPSATDLPSLESLIQATQSTPEGPGSGTGSTAPPAAPTAPGQAFNETGISPLVQKAYAGEARELTVAEADTVAANIVVVFPAGITASDIRVWVHEDATGRTQNLGGAPRFAKMGTEVVALYQTAVTAPGSGSAVIQVRVEAEGCTIAEKQFVVAAGTRTARFDVRLQMSQTPLAAQRLAHPYRW